MENEGKQFLLHSLSSHWQHSARAYQEYLEDGKRFRHAEQLRVHNIAAKNLLTENLASLPDHLKVYAEAVIDHYRVWTEKWDALKTKLDPEPGDQFVFENDHRFPRDAAKCLEEGLKTLS